ncbi:MAG: hypothetical protein ACYTF0_01635, partial [Planctomycetota bacterium]
MRVYLTMAVAMLTVMIAATEGPIAAPVTLPLDDVEALALDRAAGLAGLTPETEAWYYHHALAASLRGDHTEAARLLRSWPRDAGRNGAAYQAIRSRLRLAAYADDPVAGRRDLIDELDLHLNHRRHGSVDDELPSRLPPESIATRAFAAHANGRPERMKQTALWDLLAEDLSPERRHQVLGALRDADHPRCVQHIAADMATRHTAFAALDLHQQLTLEQLQQLRRAQPQLADDQAWVGACLGRLALPDTVDPLRDPSARLAWFERVEAFARSLGEAHRSLLAQVLYHRLAFDRVRGVFVRQRLLDYLALP